MKILVTGALGHIGSFLIRELPSQLDDIEEIRMLDNFSTQRYVSLFNLKNTPIYSFYESDVATENIERYLDGINCVINLAAKTDAASSFNNSDELMQNNISCLKNISKFCSKLEIPIIHISSTSVYGDQSSMVDENCKIDKLRPQSPYAESKIIEEEFLLQSKDLRFIIFRFGTIFGVSPGIRFHTAVNKFCYQASLGLPITVWKTALNQKRPYLDIIDAVRSIAFILKNQKFENTVFNVVTCNHTVQEIIDEIKNSISDIKINLVEHKIMNQLSYEVSAQKIEDSGFEFIGSLKNQIFETLSLFKNLNKEK